MYKFCAFLENNFKYLLLVNLTSETTHGNLLKKLAFFSSFKAWVLLKRFLG